MYSHLQPMQITTHCKLVSSQLNGTLILNFLPTVLELCSIASLMYCQQTKLSPQFLTPQCELLGEKEPFHNILPKFGACRLQLINPTFLNVFLIRSEVFKFSTVCLIIGMVFGVARIKS